MAAIKSVTLRTILQQQDDVGAVPSKTMDETAVLTALKAMGTGTRIALAPAAADQVVAFTDAVGLVIVSHDYPFKLRLAGGETLLANLTQFVLWAYDTTAGLLATSVLLTGNGTNTADLEVWVIEKP